MTPYSPTVFDVIRNCGIWSYLCLFIGGAGVMAGLIGALLALTKARNAAWIPGGVAVFAGLAAIAGGLLGRQMGLARLDEALQAAAGEITPDQVERIREQGHMEANGCIPVGFVSGSGPLFLGGIAVAVGLLARKKGAS